MGIFASGDQRRERRPQSINHLGLERAHDDRDLHLVDRTWDSTPIISGPIRRPVDGHLIRHLSARVLKFAFFLADILEFREFPRHGSLRV